MTRAAAHLERLHRLLDARKSLAAARLLSRLGAALPADQIPELLHGPCEILVRQAESRRGERCRIRILESVLAVRPDYEPGLRQLRILLEDRGDRAVKRQRLRTATNAYYRAGMDHKAAAVERVILWRRLAAKVRWFLRRERMGNLLRGAVLSGFAFLCLAFLGGYTAFRHFSEDLPDFTRLRDYRPPVITTVLDIKGRKMAEFYRQRRILTPLSAMPDHLIQAVLTAEDARFLEHDGLDAIGIVRAAIHNVQAGRIVEGGSTITQQMAKSLLLDPKRRWDRKIREAILAWRMDQQFTKKEILFLYLNQVYFGNGAWGVAAAAENYFGKAPGDLDVAESALLAGLIRSPVRDAPTLNMDRARIRRDRVLERMAALGHISPEKAAWGRRRPVRLKSLPDWFHDTAPAASEIVRRRLIELVGETRLLEDGLVIRTTIDIDWQRAGREAVSRGLASLEDRNAYPGGVRPEGALVCMEAGTGEIRALIGGRDFSESQFNRAVQSLRQPGSSFKPVIYAAALEAGFGPDSLLLDSPVAIPDNNGFWRPANYDHRYLGPVLLRTALARSRNLPAVRLFQILGPDCVKDMALRLGIRSKLTGRPSLALGASGVSLVEMTAAYGVFAAGGIRHPPVLIRSITDRTGREIPIPRAPALPVVSADVARKMTDLLMSVVESGTARKARNLNRPVAGKTGTTNGCRDAWFLGYTPDHIIGVWAGFDRERPLGPRETGGKAALPVWMDFLDTVLADTAPRPFPGMGGRMMAPMVTAKTDRRENGERNAAATPVRPPGSPAPERLVRSVTEFLKADL
ncbi:MAG: penicillin-binding protein [Desulfobacterales bacterium]|nr:MAG: penicillin-binding protein [Desulfobacterales bacterium]